MDNTRNVDATTTDADELIERSREIVSAATHLLGNTHHRPVSPPDLSSVDAALSATRVALNRKLGAHDNASEHEKARDASLALNSCATQVAVKNALIQQRADLALGVRDAMAALRNASSNSTLAQRAPIEAQRVGFRRALFSRIETGVWLADSAHATDEPDFAGALVEVGQAHPRRLSGPLLESEMVRRGTSLVVTDAQSNPRVHLELVRYTNTSSYVAAPVTVWGTTVAMMHADRGEGDDVDEFDRYMLGTYAEGLGLAMERNQMMERLQAVRSATSGYLSGITAIADDFTLSALDSAGLGPSSDGGLSEIFTSAMADDHAERLTPREWDVLRGMVSGKTNSQIATALFVSEGTVKSHVKHILRKLSASNRTEAVAHYHRLVSKSGPIAG